MTFSNIFRTSSCYYKQDIVSTVLGPRDAWCEVRVQRVESSAHVARLAARPGGPGPPGAGRGALCPLSARGGVTRYAGEWRGVRVCGCGHVALFVLYNKINEG